MAEGTTAEPGPASPADRGLHRISLMQAGTAQLDQLRQKVTAVSEKVEQESTNQAKSVHQILQNRLVTSKALNPLSPASVQFLTFLRSTEATPATIASRLNSQCNDVDWTGVLMSAIANADVVTVELMCKAGIDMNGVAIVNGITFSAFEVAGAQYDNHPSPQALLILELLALNTDKVATCAAINTFTKHTNLAPDQLKNLGLSVVKGSQFPITACLQVPCGSIAIA